MGQKMNKYLVVFSDKQGTPFYTSSPSDFLSARAIDRRAKSGIEILENDLPVNPQYVQALAQKGAVIHNRSKWLNAAAVMADSATAETLKTLPFVAKVTYIGPHLKYKNPPNRPAKPRVNTPEYPVAGTGENPYGYAYGQNDLLNIWLPHLSGARGRDIWIAVMDGGFAHADVLPFFDSIALQGRLFSGWDFVEKDNGLYESSAHGTSVLSVMGSNLSGYYIGTAPDATYFLIKTEDTGGEFPIEEVNWIAGAEWADSVGVDLINASLGYTVFNDPKLGHSYKELDGRTAIGSIGAAIAATKGMIICNSAGNEGDGPWRHIGVPADTKGIVAVGAVTDTKKIADFSSRGPTADGRIKPDLLAPGDQVVVAGTSGVQLGLSSGTSLASPMLTGAIASLWSAFPEKSAAEILDALYATGDQYTKPDLNRGYGLPDISAAWADLGQYQVHRSIFSYNPDGNQLNLLIGAQLVGSTIYLESVDSKQRFTVPYEINAHLLSKLTFQCPDKMPKGSYQVVVVGTDSVQRVPVFIW